MSDELRKAAERVMLCQYGPTDQELAARDRYQLAEHVLATVQPDDAEPVTMEWMRSLSADEIATLDILPDNSLLSWFDAPTRGQVRRLIAALRGATP